MVVVPPSSITVAKQSQMGLYNQSLAGTESSDPAEGTEVCLLSVLFVVGHRSVRRINPSSTQSYQLWCVLTECDEENFNSRRSTRVGELREKKNYYLELNN